MEFCVFMYYKSYIFYTYIICYSFDILLFSVFSHSIFYRKTVEFCKRAEKIGASFISVHGRTKSQRNEPVNLEAIKLIKENVSIPVVGNGDVYHLNDVKQVQEFTKVDGKLQYFCYVLFYCF